MFLGSDVKVLFYIRLRGRCKNEVSEEGSLCVGIVNNVSAGCRLSSPALWRERMFAVLLSRWSVVVFCSWFCQLFLSDFLFPALCWNPQCRNLRHASLTFPYFAFLTHWLYSRRLACCALSSYDSDKILASSLPHFSVGFVVTGVWDSGWQRTCHHLW